MTIELKGFTAYLNDEKDCLGLVDVYSNMGDLSVPSLYAERQSYEAEIFFRVTNRKGFAAGETYLLILRNNGECPGQVYETWKITGAVTKFSYSDNELKISLSLVEHYINGNEHIYWDPSKFIHRIDGIDYMEETRKNLAME